MIKAKNFLEVGSERESYNEYENAGKIKGFEICFELSWKFLKRVLSLRGIEVLSPKETFRNAEKENLIESSEECSNM